MDFARLYRCSHAMKRTALHVHPQNSDDPKVHAKCVFLRDPEASAEQYRGAAWWNVVERVFRGEHRLSAPIVFHPMKHGGGSTPYDLMGTTFPPLLLISDRVVSVLRGFSGWTTYPVEVHGKKGERIPGYHGLAVTGRCGPIDYTQSTPRVCEPPAPQGRRSRQWFGLCFDPRTWDGSDVFVPEGTSIKVVVEAVKQALEKAKITNADFIPLTEYPNPRIPPEFLGRKRCQDELS